MNRRNLFLSIFKNRKMKASAFFQHDEVFCDFDATWFYSDYDFWCEVVKKKGTAR